MIYCLHSNIDSALFLETKTTGACKLAPKPRATRRPTIKPVRPDRLFSTAILSSRWHQAGEGRAVGSILHCGEPLQLRRHAHRSGSCLAQWPSRSPAMSNPHSCACVCVCYVRAAANSSRRRTGAMPAQGRPRVAGGERAQKE